MADADLIQYSPSAADAETANTQNGLTGQLLVVVDGTEITADTNGAGDGPVNRSIKKLAERIAGLRGWLVGNIAGVTRRTIHSLHVDGTGGNSSTAIAGQVRASTVRGSTWIGSDDGTDAATLYPQSLIIDVAADGKIDVQDDRIVFTKTNAADGNPASTVSIANQLRPLNLVKVFGRVTFSGGGATVEEGAHITSAAPNGPNIKITFASSFDNDDYVVVRNGQNGAAVPVHVKVAVRNVAYVELLLIGVDAAVDDGEVDFAILGRQTT